MQRLVGEVQATNEKGIRIDGSWHNFSKYAKPDALAPVQAGQWAELQIDGSGFVRAVIAQTKPAPAEPPAEYADDEPSADVRVIPSKDQLIVRQTCLKVASEFTSLRTNLKSCDMIKLAEQLEKWCWR
jgi:hypothetical protein